MLRVAWLCSGLRKSHCFVVAQVDRLVRTAVYDRDELLVRMKIHLVIDRFRFDDLYLYSTSFTEVRSAVDHEFDRTLQACDLPTLISTGASAPTALK